MVWNLNLQWEGRLIMDPEQQENAAYIAQQEAVQQYLQGLQERLDETRKMTTEMLECMHDMKAKLESITKQFQKK